MGSAIEPLGVVTGILGVWLTVRQNPWCWPVGIVSVLLFAVVFFEARLYGSAALQLGYVIVSAYGWYAWRHPAHDALTLPVTRVPAGALGVLIAAAAVATVALGAFLRTQTNAALPWLDAGTTAYSLAAQIMATRKWVESWIAWMVIDVVYVAMYLSQGLMLTAGLYGVFLALAVLGYREWRVSMAATPAGVVP